MRHTMFKGALALLLLFLVLPAQARAYIDPATTTYVIQIVSAVVITLGITIGVFFSRIRMFVLNARVKTAEWRVKLFSGKQPAAAVPDYMRYFAGVQAPPRGKWAALWHDERSYWQRLLSGLIVSAAIAYTFMAFGPYELYALNIHSFAFRLGEVYGILLALTGAAILLLALVLPLFRGKVFDALISLLTGMLLAGYLQGNFLNTSLGRLTGDFIVWHQYGSEFVLNLAVWVVLIAVPFLLHHFWKKVWAFTVRFIPLLLVGMQLISMIPLWGEIRQYQPDTEQYVSTAGLYEVSSDENIIVFILDRMDNNYVEQALASDPQLLDRLDGFTRFTNNTTRYTATFPSASNLLTGEAHYYEIPSSDFLTEAYKTSTFLPKLRENGFLANVYAEQRFVYANASDLQGVADNVEATKLSLRKAEAAREFVLLSAFRYAPIAFKPFVWTTTERFAHVIDKEIDPPPYITDDPLVYQTLREKRLTVDAHGKRFSYIHLNGPHAPFTMGAEGQAVPPEEGNLLDQTKGSFHLVYEYLDQLKALGLYKNATIIITADHGARQDDILPVRAPITAALFVKPSGQEGTALRINSAPVSTENFGATIYEAAGLPHADLGQTYFEVPADAAEPRYLYHWLAASPDGPMRYLVYEITNNARDFANWKLVEENIIPET